MMYRTYLLSLWLLAMAPFSHADDVYLSVDDFLAQTFQRVPEPQVVWLNAERKAQGQALLGHPPGGLRVRYWQQGARTAWIWDEIGKEHPITLGFVIDAGQIERVVILVYRESRGGEVRHDFFTRQFTGATLQARRLDRDIDGISGATLSVNAVTAVARWVLYLHRQVAP